MNVIPADHYNLNRKQKQGGSEITRIINDWKNLSGGLSDSFASIEVLCGTKIKLWVIVISLLVKFS